MTAAAQPSLNRQRSDTLPGVTVHVAFRFRQIGGRKRVVLPDGNAWTPEKACAQPDNTLVKALARARRWQRMLDSGDYATIQDLAATEKVTPSFLARMLRLTTLAPVIVEAILEARQKPNVTLAALMTPFPMLWDEQERLWGD